jgi:tyrosine-protein kinase Etk/Wzc
MPDKKSSEVLDRARVETADPSSRTAAGTVLELLSLVTGYRKFISWFVLSITVAVTVIAILLPRWYKSTASVFPAEKADLLGGLEGMASVAKALSPARALSALGSNPEADRYLAILKSGKVLGAVIEKFDLVNVYEITSYPGEKTMKELLSNTEVVLEPEGNITIAVYDRDPQRAADMANYFVEMLNRTNSELQVQNARGNRKFIEDRYSKNLSDLAAAEDSLKAFQKKFGVIAMPEQTEASIKAMAEINAQLALKEVEANVLRRTQSAESPTVMAADIQVEEIKKKLSDMSTGRGQSTRDMNVFVPFSKVPDLGGEYIRRFREVEIQYKILQILTPLYEQAKVEERRQTPSVIVLDRAGPAERKAKPKISLYALMAFVFSLLTALVMVFAREMVVKLRGAHPERFDQMVSTLRRDWLGLRIHRKTP